MDKGTKTTIIVTIFLIIIILGTAFYYSPQSKDKRKLSDELNKILSETETKKCEEIEYSYLRIEPLIENNILTIITLGMKILKPILIADSENKDLASESIEQSQSILSKYKQRIYYPKLECEYKKTTTSQEIQKHTQSIKSQNWKPYNEELETNYIGHRLTEKVYKIEYFKDNLNLEIKFYPNKKIKITIKKYLSEKAEPDKELKQITIKGITIQQGEMISAENLTYHNPNDFFLKK